MRHPEQIVRRGDAVALVGNRRGLHQGHGVREGQIVAGRRQHPRVDVGQDMRRAWNHRRRFVWRNETLDGEGPLGSDARHRRFRNFGERRRRGFPVRRQGGRTHHRVHVHRRVWGREEYSVYVGQSGQLVLQDFLVALEQFEPLPSPQQAPVDEHVEGGRMQGPVGPLSGPVGLSGDLDEAVVEGQVVPERILPPLRVFPVVRKPVRYELVYLRQGQHFLWGIPNGHRRERYVGVRGLLVAIRVPGWPRHVEITYIEIHRTNTGTS